MPPPREQTPPRTCSRSGSTGMRETAVKLYVEPLIARVPGMCSGVGAEATEADGARAALRTTPYERVALRLPSTSSGQAAGA